MFFTLQFQKLLDFVPKARQLFLKKMNQGANQVTLLKQIEISNKATSHCF